VTKLDKLVPQSGCLTFAFKRFDSVDAHSPLSGRLGDWGAGHTYSALATRPNIVRSWAADVKSHINDEFARCILALYRDAIDKVIPMGKQFVAARPKNGLVIIAEADQYAGSLEAQKSVATSVNAATATINDAGHWWMCSHPAAAASILIEHWASIAN